MLKKTVVAALFGLALAAAGVAAAAAVTHQSSGSSAASNATAGRVTLHTTKVGKVLATSSGRTLYLFLADKHGRSACYGKCANFWPPLKIGHRDARGVEGRVRARTQALQAALRKRGDLGIGGLVELFLRPGAAECMRGAGATLVEEHDIAIAVDASEGGGDARVKVPGRLSRSAGEHEQRIRLLAAVDGRHARHVQADMPPARRGRVLGHLEHAAVGRHDREAQGMRDLAGGECECVGHGACRRGGEAAGEEAARKERPKRAGHARLSRLAAQPSVRLRI